MSCGAVRAVAEVDAVQPGVDVDLGARRVVVPGAVVHPRSADLVGQPRPAALDRRFRRDLQRLLDGGLVGDRCVELNDDRRGDADNLTVGELELAVDLGAGIDGRELALHRDGLAVVADHRAAPAVRNAVAQRFGGSEAGAVTVERARDDLAVGVGKRDALEPAVLHLHAHGCDGRHIGRVVGGLVGDGRGSRRGWGLRGRFADLAAAGCERGRCDDSDRQGGQGPTPTDLRRQWGSIRAWAHVEPGYLESAANQNRLGCEFDPECRSDTVSHRPGQRNHVRGGGVAAVGQRQRVLGRQPRGCAVAGITLAEAGPLHQPARGQLDPVRSWVVRHRPV